MVTGDTIGPYKIIGMLGEGGMGQVWRATDTTLNRQVAIKILPDAFASDPERLARFEREAKALASLNHPHIAAIYGFEKSSGMHALVMELVEGDDLSQRIARGAMPLDEALPIAKQIAEALEAAHEQGIVHRDLKPANIKVRADGTVKVLDFGLAKAMAPAGASSANAMTSPTLSIHATQAGMILGTAAYMAPEQARGAAVDTRADVWAFGVVLWEMLTGQRLFEGATVSDTLASVLKTDPQWNALAPATPAAIRRLLRRCLEKDRRRRLDSAAAVRLEIEDALSVPPPVDGVAASATQSAPAGRRAWMPALAVAAILVLAIPAALYFRPAPPDRSLTRLEFATPPTADVLSMALSPDGRRIAFAAADEKGPRLWLRPFDQAAATALPGTDGASYPFWAPDGGAIGFFADGKVKRIDLSGGAPLVLADAPSGRGGAWNSHGVILFAPSTNSGLVHIPDAGGTPSAVTELKSSADSHRWPQFLPDGRQFLFVVAIGPLETRGTYVGSLDGGTPTRVLADETAAVFAPPGRLLVLRQGGLMALGFDPVRAVASGEPVVVAQNVGADTVLARGAFSVSATGVLAHRPGGSQSRQLAWVDRAGRLVATLGDVDDGGSANPALSPDDQRVAVSRNVQGNTDIWLLDARGVRSRFTFSSDVDSLPLWSPDGRRVIFRSGRNGVGDLFEKAAGGAADEHPLLVTPENKAPQDWSPDGRTVLYTVLNPKTGADLWALPLDGDKKPVPVLQSQFNEMDAQFSPDGRWIAYESNQSGQAEIVVRPFPESGGQWQVSNAGGTQPRWRADGKELFYMSRDGRLMATPIAAAADGRSLTPGAPAALFALRLASGASVTVGSYTGRPQYAVARDGRFLVNLSVDAEATAPISIVLNWDAPLRK